MLVTFSAIAKIVPRPRSSIVKVNICPKHKTSLVLWTLCFLCLTRALPRW